MTALLRAYLALSAAFPFIFRLLAARAHRKMGADPGRFAERLGDDPRPRPPGRLIWVNAASVGEVVAAADLSRDLAALTGAQLLVTTTSQTAVAIVARHLPFALHAFAPVDTPAATGRFLDHWRPDLAIMIEAEIWPRMLHCLAARGVPRALLNMRPSRSRQRSPGTSAQLLGQFDLITCQSPAVQDELIGLGLSPARLGPVGDIKAAADPLPCDLAELARLQAGLAARPVWAAVSTHRGDEAAVLAAHLALLKTEPQALLIWVPRHPARGIAIAAACRAAGLALRSRSQGQDPEAAAPVWLCDTLGDTGLVFRLAGSVFLGGSFGPEGGHNPWEPARLGAHVLHGPRVAHFGAAYAALAREGAARMVADGAGLARALTPRRAHAPPSRLPGSADRAAITARLAALLG